VRIFSTFDSVSGMRFILGFETGYEYVIYSDHPRADIVQAMTLRGRIITATSIKESR